MNNILDSEDLDIPEDLLKRFMRRTFFNAIISYIISLVFLYAFMRIAFGDSSIETWINIILHWHSLIFFPMLILATRKTSNYIGKLIAFRKINSFVGFLGILYTSMFITAISSYLIFYAIHELFVGNTGGVEIYLRFFVMNALLVLFPFLFLAIIFGEDLRTKRNELSSRLQNPKKDS